MFVYTQSILSYFDPQHVYLLSPVQIYKSKNQWKISEPFPRREGRISNTPFLFVGSQENKVSKFIRIFLEILRNRGKVAANISPILNEIMNMSGVRPSTGQQRRSSWRTNSLLNVRLFQQQALLCKLI